MQEEQHWRPVPVLPPVLLLLLLILRYSVYFRGDWSKEGGFNRGGQRAATATSSQEVPRECHHEGAEEAYTAKDGAGKVKQLLSLLTPISQITEIPKAGQNLATAPPPPPAPATTTATLATRCPPPSHSQKGRRGRNQRRTDLHPLPTAAATTIPAATNFVAPPCPPPPPLPPLNTCSTARL